MKTTPDTAKRNPWEDPPGSARGDWDDEGDWVDYWRNPPHLNMVDKKTSEPVGSPVEAAVRPSQ